jgi:hypothetical protein
VCYAPRAVFQFILVVVWLVPVKEIDDILVWIIDHKVETEGFEQRLFRAEYRVLTAFNFLRTPRN